MDGICSSAWFGSFEAGPAREEAAAYTAELDRSGVSRPSVMDDASIAASRAAERGNRTESSVPTRDHEVETADGSVTVRLFEPGSPARGGCLVVHGGGWMLGGADLDDAGLSSFAQSQGLLIGSVEYRLAPEHPYPAAVDDCEAAALWFIEHCREEHGLDRLVTIGGSAGAHLVALTLLRLRDRHAPGRSFAGAVLAAGAYDMSMTPSQRLWTRDLVISNASLATMYESFTPGLTAEQRRHPDISPLYADLRGLPPAIFTVGTADPLLDDTLFMASRWRVAGNEAELHVLPEGIHGFAALPLEIARQYDAANGAFLDRIFGA